MVQMVNKGLQEWVGFLEILRNHREVLFMFSKYVKVEGSNEVKALAILEVFDCIHVPSKTV